ncbi:MAG: hypothetical protein F6K40_29550 [Okeania sp. SIO3I5]|uniref:hypothetical protein n=1 Tax=Okeania sp. SIO3I5 TaxID=2607805 RepID=UPI0013BA66C0|nr:hypothetical protein [Okeania sp. SIO3I5]NEQ40164.1 hypothetical protein [Okeania sp. SIO3I5]
MLNTITIKEPLNPDQNVNHGCNLKWKLDEKEEEQLSTIEVWRTRIISENQ